MFVLNILRDYMILDFNKCLVLVPFLRTFAKFLKVTIILSRLSVRRPARNYSAYNRRIFVKFHIRVLFENLSRIYNFH